MFTDKEKSLLFYSLEAFQRTLYQDVENNKIDYIYENYMPVISEINDITTDLNKLNNIIDVLLNKLCK